jgi:hypothetical protein
MAQTLCLSDSDRRPMAEAQDNAVQEGLKYLGYLFVALLTMLFGWIAKLIGNWITKKFNEYVTRIENAVGKVEDIAKDIKQLKESDTEILKRLAEAEKAQQAHAEIQKDQSRDINAIKKHLNLD